VKYLMRVKNQSMKEFNEAKEPDQIIEINVEGKTIKVRVLRLMLDSDVEEVLVTNLLDESPGIQAFKALYFKRWGIEVKYNELKNRLQLQNFTGDTVIAVEQDFYASMYLANMVALAKNEANEEIAQKNEDKNLKYDNPYRAKRDEQSKCQEPRRSMMLNRIQESSAILKLGKLKPNFRTKQEECPKETFWILLRKKQRM